MKLKFMLLAGTLCIGLAACGGDDPIEPTPEKEEPNDTLPTPTPGEDPVEVKELAKGADISWCTQMEDKGQKFYGFASREPKECTAAKHCVSVSSLATNSVFALAPSVQSLGQRRCGRNWKARLASRLTTSTDSLKLLVLE